MIGGDSKQEDRSTIMSTRLDVHFSSRTPEWSTPDDLFAELNGIFHFDLDACASPANAKCARYFT